ncbi:MAG: response regulator [Archangiaceae bacterium]|nr:response regulator [Archangiaceae bacterium]
MKTRGSPLTGCTILVIDDDADARELLAEALRHAGCTVLGAANGLEALAQLEQGAKPAAMLVDLDMPLMDGRVFCEYCDAVPALAAIPRVLLTGNPHAAFFLSRARRVLSKPADTDLVLETLCLVCQPVALAA